MFTYQHLSTIAEIVWGVTWLPGIFLFVYRLTKLLQNGRRIRAALEGLLLAGIPVAAWGLYAWSETTMMLRAGMSDGAADTATYLVQMPVPYLASLISIFALRFTVGTIEENSPRLLAIAVGLITAPIAASAPFFSLLTLVLGG